MTALGTAVILLFTAGMLGLALAGYALAAELPRATVLLLALLALGAVLGLLLP